MAQVTCELIKHEISVVCIAMSTDEDFLFRGEFRMKILVNINYYEEKRRKLKSTCVYRFAIGIA